MYKTAVVIVNYNDSDRIITLVKKLLKYKILDKIIISDNNSTIEEKEKIKHIESSIVKVIYNKENLGFSGANNIALKYLESEKIDYVFTINSDVDVTKDVMLKSINFISSHEDISLVSAEMIENNQKKQCYYNFPTITRCIAENLGLLKLFNIKPKIIQKYDEYYLCDYIRSSYWCVRYEDFKNIGFFDIETFLYHIETCVGIKLNRQGKKCAIINNLTYEHNHIYKKGYKIRGYKDSYKSLVYIFNHYYNKNKLQMLLLLISYKIGLLIRKVLGIY
jgi:GT2 family glycosyltransferase